MCFVQWKTPWDIWIQKKYFEKEMKKIEFIVYFPFGKNSFSLDTS